MPSLRSGTQDRNIDAQLRLSRAGSSPTFFASLAPFAVARSLRSRACFAPLVPAALSRRFAPLRRGSRSAAPLGCSPPRPAFRGGRVVSASLRRSRCWSRACLGSLRSARGRGGPNARCGSLGAGPLFCRSGVRTLGGPANVGPCRFPLAPLVPGTPDSLGIDPRLSDQRPKRMGPASGGRRGTVVPPPPACPLHFS